MPPGFGRPSTHSRNRRRRLKKKHDQQPVAGITFAAPTGISLTNSHPLGTTLRIRKDRGGPAEDVASALNNAFGVNAEAGELDPGTNVDADPAAVVTSPSPSNEGMRDVMMSNLRNKNKKKGFKQSMAAPLRRKIVFANSDPLLLSQVQTEAIAESDAVVVDALARLTPPSEKQDRGELPPRMFVTSVNVEEGMWVPTKKSSNKTQNDQKERLEQEICGGGSVAYGVDVSQGKPPVVEGDSAETCDLDWDLAEKRWETSDEISHPEQLKVGSVVGWKVRLGIVLDRLQTKCTHFPT